MTDVVVTQVGTNVLLTNTSNVVVTQVSVNVLMSVQQKRRPFNVTISSSINT